jgi:anti-sigma factor RsiW
MLEHHHCPPLEIVTAYVTGDLSGDVEHTFEAHLAECSTCAQRLQHESCLELELHEAAQRLAPGLPCSRARRWTNAASHGVGALAAAACVLLTLGLSSPWLHDDMSSDASIARASNPMTRSEGERLACVPALDEGDCEQPSRVAARDTSSLVLWTELPEPIDPATCWFEEESTDLVCTSTEASG